MTGEEEREKGMARAAAGTTSEWRELAEAVVTALAEADIAFTPDDVWDAGLPRPAEPRALGPVMMKLSRQGVIRPTGQWVPSRNPSQHATPIREWVGCV